MEQQYMESKGQFEIVALVDDSYKYITSSYKIYKNGMLVSEVENYAGMAFFLMSKHGFELSEIEFAVRELNKNEHDTAHFGVFGTFLFTSDSLETKSSGVA